MSDEIAIRVEHVSKDFVLPHEKANSVKSLFTGAAKRHAKKGKETQHALKDISFEIKKGEFFGIVGRNGSGKSTLLKILAGIYQPTSGKTYTQGKLVPFIELGVGFNPELTGRENVYLNGAMLGFSRKEVEAMYDSIVAFAELERFMDQKLKNYSSGMQVRLAFSMAVRANADILLIDEVLAVGDADFQRKCFEYFKRLKKDKKTVVFVSHDMGAIREFCDRALLINDSEVVKIGKNTDIANEYNKLFMEEVEPGEGYEEEEVIVDSSGKRWGNENIKIKEVRTELKEDNISIKVIASVQRDIDNLIYGLHICAQDGQELTAMNNRMLNESDLRDLKAGQTVNLDWQVFNIFNDGKYFVTLTLVSEAGLAYDWFVDAASFTVKRAERSTTAILPPVQVKYKITSNAKA
jgi:ABC-2 type transport system ATP-binding protein